MKINHYTAVMLISFLMCIVATPAYANIGVPMLAVIWPVSWLLLIPVILIESVVALIVLRNSWKTGLKVSSVANIVSTFIGIPITWVLLVIIQFITGGSAAWGIESIWQKVAAVTIQSPWLIPYDEEMNWMINSAAAFLCIPMFFMSVWVENRVGKRFFNKNNWALVKRWAWIANGVTYSLIVLGLLIALLNSF